MNKSRCFGYVRKPVSTGVLFAWLLLMSMNGQVSAQDRLTIEGPEVVSACQLVRLDVQLEEDESALWIVEPDSLDYEIVRNRLVFALGCETEATVMVVAASVQDGSVKFRQVRHRVRVGNGANPPPSDPKPPNQPTKPTPIQPERDWSAITDWIQGNAAARSDPETSANFAQQLNLAAIAIEGKSLDQARQIIGQVRRSVFVDRSEFNTDWNPFLMELDSRIKADPPKTVSEYRELILAISKGLKQ